MAGDENLIPPETREQSHNEAAKLSDQDEIAAALKLLENDSPPKEAPKEEPQQKQEEKPAETSAEKPLDKGDESGEKPRGGVAKAWAAVTKADQQNRAERAALKREREQLQRDREALQQKPGESPEAFKARLLADPLGTLQEAGLPFDKLAEGVVAGKFKAGQEAVAASAAGKPMTEEEINARIAKGVQEQVERIMAAQQQEAGYRNQIKELLATDNFKLLATNPEAEQQAMMAVESYYSSQGEVLPPTTILASMQETWKEHLNSLRSNQAVREILGLSSETPSDQKDSPEKPAPEKPAPKEAAPIDTISDQLNSPSQPSELPDDLSEEEEIRRAAALISDNATDVLRES